MPERPASAVVAGARVDRDHGAGGAGAAGGRTDRGLSGCTSSIRTRHAGRRRRSTRSMPAVRTTAKVAATDAALAPLLDDRASVGAPDARRRDRRSRRSARRSRRAVARVCSRYESTLRVPLIISAVRRSRQSRESRAARSRPSPARHVDILPTILDAAGAARAGRSARAHAAAGGGAPRQRSAAAVVLRGDVRRCSIAAGRRSTGVLVDREKFIDLPLAERYDLSADPGEALEPGRPIGRARSHARRARLRAFAAAAPATAPRRGSPDAVARLRALGYVSGSAPAKAALHRRRRSRSSWSSSTAALHRRGRSVRRAGAIDEAVRIYRRRAGAAPDMAIAYRHLAFIEWQRGDAPGAIDALQRAVKAGVTDRRGRDAARRATSPTRAASPRRFGLLEPLRAGVRRRCRRAELARHRLRRGRDGRDEARRAFERVLAIDPASSVPLENLGMLALERGDLADARSCFEQALARRSAVVARARRASGWWRSRSGDRAGARSRPGRRAVQLDPRNFDALYNIGTTLARGRPDRPTRGRISNSFSMRAPPAFYAKDLREVAALLRQ